MTCPQSTVAKAFVELADTLVTDFDVIDFLDLMTVHSAQALRAAGPRRWVRRRTCAAMRSYDATIGQMDLLTATTVVLMASNSWWRRR